MTRFTLASIAGLIVASMATAYALQGQTQSWPPGLHQVPDASPEDSPARTPEAEMKTFFLPPGYHVELVASEPMVEDPIFIDWDSRGRMWVLEEIGYMQDLPATNANEPIGRISVLEDTNNDGKMDKKTVFLDHLVLPRAFKVLEHGVLVEEPPHLWFAHDTNGDLKADTKELVCDCYGNGAGGIEHNQNGLVWTLDNWMHSSEGTTYSRWKDGKIEIGKTLSRGQWGASQDDFGHIYRNSNSSALGVDLVPTPYFARNPNLLRQRGSYEFMGETNALNQTFPSRPNRGVNRGYVDGQLRADGTLATYTGTNSPTVYRGDRLPAELEGNVFIAEPTGNLVSRIIVADTGTTLRGKKAYDNTEFITSTDERFRPVYLSNAPDGTLYVVDMYHGIIQDKGFITEYLRDEILKRKLEQPIHMGRIYRVMHDTTRRDVAPTLETESSAQLVTRLSHPNGWWRDTAQRVLVERNDKAVVPALRQLADTAKDPRFRLHALWTLDGMDSLEPATVIKALSDPSRDERVSAIRLSERWLTAGDAAVQAAVLKRLDDTDWNVRQQLAATLGMVPQGARETAMVTLFERYGSDPVVMDAALSGVRGSEGAVLEKVLLANAQTPEREAAIALLTATIMRGGQDAPIQVVFRHAAEAARPEWQRSALLRGAEVALLGAAVPGPATGRGGRGGAAGAGAAVAGAAPAAGGGRTGAAGAGGGAGGRAGAAAAGSRGGPGGNPAFPRATPAPAAAGAAAEGGDAAPPAGAGGGRGGGAAGGPLRLNRAPELVALAANDKGDLGTRATSLLARVEWPGKPGAAAPVAPLTAAEQQRFDAGQEIYKAICQPCHQPDGRGLERVAPPLLGSVLALAPATIPARILINGKEGSIGEMPPLGAGFTDDQIAAVLTYVRREWGQAGTPVDVATVKDTRAQVAGRTKPWTNPELMALIGATGGGRGRQ